MGAYLKAMRNDHRIHGSIYLDILTVSKSNVTVNKATKIMTMEMSDLKGSDFSFERRIWLNSCDVGFIMSSRDTGKKVLFVESRRETNEGDLVSVSFIPYKEPSLEGWVFVLIND
jgi:hypothetical protein